jgi:hypothetical protein
MHNFITKIEVFLCYTKITKYNKTCRFEIYILRFTCLSFLCSSKYKVIWTCFFALCSRRNSYFDTLKYDCRFFWKNGFTAAEHQIPTPSCEHWYISFDYFRNLKIYNLMNSIIVSFSGWYHYILLSRVVSMYDMRTLVLWTGWHKSFLRTLEDLHLQEWIRCIHELAVWNRI